MANRYYYNGEPLAAQDNSPDNMSCPNCKRYNAMLFNRTVNANGKDHALRCRDCGAEVIVLVDSDK